MTIITPFANFNRPANTTQYADGDLISNTAIADDFAPLKFNISRLDIGAAIHAIRLYKSSNTTSAADFILNLFTKDPELSVADNTALALPDGRYFVATVDCDMSSGSLAGSGGNLFKRFELSTPILIDPKAFQAKEIIGVLEADGAYTPASEELFEVTLEISNTL